MLGICILVGLLAGLVMLNLAALRWGIDSRDSAVQPGIGQYRRGTCDE